MALVYWEGCRDAGAAGRTGSKNRREQQVIDIERLRMLNSAEQMAITEHARRRLTERGISVNDIIRCIDTGEIIKQYEDDKPFPSCLILGSAMDGEAIHVVASHDSEWLYLITAYHPDADVWEPDLKTRKER